MSEDKITRCLEYLPHRPHQIRDGLLCRGLEPAERERTLGDRLSAATARAERAEMLVRSVDLFGTGFLWKRPDGTEHVLDPSEVVVVIAADQQSERERLTARAERAEAAIERIRELIDSYPSGSVFAQSGAQALFRHVLNGDTYGE